MMTSTLTEAQSGDMPFDSEAIPDPALRIQLDSFSGPLELLLYLIKSQEIDIFDIPIVKITAQYLLFLDAMRDEQLEVAGDFLVMAATLIQIKSRMLLPPEINEEEEEEIEEDDPRLELVGKLLEYRRYRAIAQELGDIGETVEDWLPRKVKTRIESVPEEEEDLEVTLYDLIEAFRRMLRHFTEDLVHTIAMEGASVDDKIEWLEAWLVRAKSLSWSELLVECGYRVEVVCCFLAILELCRMGRIQAHQLEAYGEIRIHQQDEAAEPA